MMAHEWIGGRRATTVRAVVIVAALQLAACGGERRAATGGDSKSPPASGASAADTPAAAATPSSRPARRDPVQRSATVVIGSATAAFSGLGECHHTENASIFEAPAAMWSATLDTERGDLRYLNLTRWRLKAGGDIQVSLAITVGEATHRIATVKGGDIHGAGGILTVDGKDDGGRTVGVKVECSAFTEPIAEGG